VLEVKGLFAGYGPQTVLHDINIACDTGHVVCIVGPNGAGKSTLMRAITGVIKPSKGAVTWNGRDITSASPHRIVARGIGYVQEGRHVFAPLTVMENLKAGGLLTKRKSRKLYDEQLETVQKLFPELSDRMGQPAGTLSGGQQQMVALGRALMGRPELLLLDEPSLGLAPIVIDRIYENIRGFRDAGMGLIIVEPSPERVISIAESISVLAGGQIRKVGKPEEFAVSGDDLMNVYFGAST
jgi:branched-chain amino acid transport system ATP-binding protein